MKETTIQKKIMLALSRIGTTIFRNNVGTAWVGESKRALDGSGVFLKNPRPLHAGLCKGSSDLIGWTTIEIDGKKVAVFTAIENKTKSGRVSPEQANFIENVKRSGGIAGVARTDNEAVDIIKKWMISVTACLLSLVCSSQITFKGRIYSDVPQTVQAQHGDTIGYCTPRNGKFVIKNIDQPVIITLLPSGKVIELNGADQPKHTIKMAIFIDDM